MSLTDRYELWTRVIAWQDRGRFPTIHQATEVALRVCTEIEIEAAVVYDVTEDRQVWHWDREQGQGRIVLPDDSPPTDFRRDFD